MWEIPATILERTHTNQVEKRCEKYAEISNDGEKKTTEMILLAYVYFIYIAEVERSQGENMRNEQKKKHTINPKKSI